MRSIDFISAVIVIGLICSSSQGLLTEKSNNTSSPQFSCQPLQINEETFPSTKINNSTLWLADPCGGYCRMFCASLQSGEQIKAELVPAVDGNLTVYRKHLYGNASTQNMGPVLANNRYFFWIRAGPLTDGEPWYNELWYRVDGVKGEDSNHIWYYVYEERAPQYFKYNRSAVI